MDIHSTVIRLANSHFIKVGNITLNKPSDDDDDDNLILMDSVGYNTGSKIVTYFCSGRKNKIYEATLYGNTCTPTMLTREESCGGEEKEYIQKDEHENDEGTIQVEESKYIFTLW